MNQVLCPKCGSDQVTSNKKGFSGKKAIVGDVLLGPVGLLAGTLGSNKIKITCLSCGNQFKPGEGASSVADFDMKKKKKQLSTSRSVIFAVAILFIGLIGKTCSSEDKNDAKTENVASPTTIPENDFEANFKIQKIEQFKQLVEDDKSANRIKAEALALTKKILKENDYQLM